jgi:type III secretion system FlhB-like substrate exporter
MSAEERALRAIKLTRNILLDALNDSFVLVQMIAHDVTPEAIEDTIAEILAYLDKTKEEG